MSFPALGWRFVACGFVVAACSSAPIKPEVVAVEQKKPELEAPALPEGVAPAKPEEKPAPRVEVSDERKAQGRELFAKARVAAEQGELDVAVTLFGQAAQADPELVWALYDAGVLLMRQGKNDEAVDRFVRAIRRQPEFTEASENLLRLRLKRGERALAERELAARIGLYPKNLALRGQYVRVLVAGGSLEQALTEAKKVLKADERNVPALLALADVWYRQKKLELAKDVLQNAAQIDPSNAEVANLQGFVSLSLGDKPLALEAFKRAAQLNPQFAEARSNLGALLNEAGDFEAAILELESATRVLPDQMAIWLNLGNAYRGARRYEDAEKAWRRALALSPRSADPLFNLGLLYLDGELKDKKPLDRLQQAVAYFDQYKVSGGQDGKAARYQEEARKGMRREQEKLAREERDKLKKVEAARKQEAEHNRRESGKLGKLDDDEGPSRDAGKLGGKDDEGPTPEVTRPAPRPAGGKLGGEDDK